MVSNFIYTANFILIIFALVTYCVLKLPAVKPA